MFNIHVFVSLTLFVVVVHGNPANIKYNGLKCENLRPIALTRNKVADNWYGMEIYTNVGVVQLYDSEASPCYAASLKSLNSTRYRLTMFSVGGTPGVDFDNELFYEAIIDTSGNLQISEDIRKYGVVVAEEDKKYVTVAFCTRISGLPFVPVTRLMTFYQYVGQPDLNTHELKKMRKIIKKNLRINKLEAEELDCHNPYEI